MKNTPKYEAKVPDREITKSPICSSIISYLRENTTRRFGDGNTERGGKRGGRGRWVGKRERGESEEVEGEREKRVWEQEEGGRVRRGGGREGSVRR